MVGYSAFANAKAACKPLILGLQAALLLYLSAQGFFDFLVGFVLRQGIHRPNGGGQPAQ